MTPLEITNVEKVEKVLSGKFISQSTEEEIKDKLKIIYAMIGLRPQHFPVDEEKQFLHTYIFTKYGNKTLNELVLAFDLAIQGQLDVEDVKVYDQFSCEYLAKIMNAYRKWLAQVSKNSQTIKKDMPVIEEKTELTQQEKEEWVAEWKNNPNRNFLLIPTIFYDYIGLTDYESNLEKAMVYCKKEIMMQNELQSIKDRKLAEFNRQQNEGFEGEYKGRIINMAKRISINNYFNKQDV